MTTGADGTSPNGGRQSGPSAERFADLGKVTLCYQTFGDPTTPTMVLIMGLGFQLVHWPDDFCRGLAAHGFHVVRFDNRDAGRSTHCPGEDYTLEDMADDVIGLLDALDAPAAHVVGASLGGMLAQLVAIRHPDRVRSLASLMSTTGRRGKGRTSPVVLRHLLARTPRTEEEAIERRVRIFAAIGSPGLDQDVDELRRVTAAAFRRDPDARGGRRRQHRAVRAAADRTAALRTLKVPAVVVHGTADRMCHPSGGHATAAAIPKRHARAHRGDGPRSATSSVASHHRRHRAQRPARTLVTAIEFFGRPRSSRHSARPVVTTPEGAYA